MKSVTVKKKQAGGSLYWHEYRVLAGKTSALTFSTLSPDFDEEWGGFLLLMNSLGVTVEVVEE